MSTLLEKDKSIELLKAIAAILITNSHMSQMYGDWKILATGGAIGDVLFFFCSGYTLFFGKEIDFINWYKKRLCRILPTIFVLALFHLSFSINQISYSMPINLGSGWFIPCILLYYIIFYPIRKYLNNKIWHVFIVSLLLVLLWYVFIGVESPDHNIYGATYFKWIHYFPFMILGSIMGKKKKELIITKTQKNYRFFPTLLTLIFSTVLFYFFCAFKLYSEYEYLQLLSLPPLMIIVVYFWRLCNTTFANSIINQRYCGSILLFIGSLCLEIYIGQSDILTTALNPIFPFNIPLLFIGIIIYGYILRCCSRFWVQTFNYEPYKWTEIIRAI